MTPPFQIGQTDAVVAPEATAAALPPITREEIIAEIESIKASAEQGSLSMAKANALGNAMLNRVLDGHPLRAIDADELFEWTSDGGWDRERDAFAMLKAATTDTLLPFMVVSVLRNPPFSLSHMESSLERFIDLYDSVFGGAPEKSADRFR